MESIMPLAPAEFDFVRRMVAERAGIVLSSTQGYLVESKLNAVVQTTGLHSIEELMTDLRRGASSRLRERVAEAMTINETSFFRDIHPFDALRSAIIPAIAAARKSERKLSFWCAASSSGQEPYSIAIILAEHFPELADWNVKILATDLSDEMLVRSREGIYTQFEVNRGLPVRLLVKYFDRKGTDWQVREPLRKMIEFRKLNLTMPWPTLPDFDFVSIRNVLIYFDNASKRSIFEHIRTHIRPDGYMLLGGSETLLGLNVPFVRHEVDKSVFYRPV